MSLIDTPSADRLHITILGKTNSGKSSLINLLAGQETSIVSNIHGTTTDNVSKAIEIQGIGACLLIDTPGFDDKTTLKEKRLEQIKKAIKKTDIAIVLCEDESYNRQDASTDRYWAEHLKAKNIPIIFIVNKIDVRKNSQQIIGNITANYNQTPIVISTKTNVGIENVRLSILEKIPEDYHSASITGDLVEEGDLVLMVMPQDIQAPKGRLILPQVQTIRQLLDQKCIVVSCTTDKYINTLSSLRDTPKLIITDSQVFNYVHKNKPQKSMLTSFSVLFAAYKGDIDYFIKSASAIDTLTENSRVLIAEACTHAPASEDIGRVKIPQILRDKVGSNLKIDIVAGTDFPSELKIYDLIIHCGGCMFNRKHLIARVNLAKQQGVAMTNYGVAIAYITGILPEINYKKG